MRVKGEGSIFERNSRNLSDSPAVPQETWDDDGLRP